MAENRPGILIVEDDPHFGRSLAEYINQSAAFRFQIFRAETVRQALDTARQYPALRFIVLDIMLEGYAPFTAEETDHGRLAGLRLLREFAEVLPRAQVYVKNHLGRQEVLDSARRVKSVIRVTSRVSAEEVARLAGRVYDNEGPEILIMHGHDRTTLGELQLFIQNGLKLGQPKILRDLPDDGRTIIEKLEHYAQRADLVFGLLTEDDVTGEMRRARQNVIFELGYFMGAFGRKSGRVIMLSKGAIEIPSDLEGIVRIDVSNGIAASAERIRGELSGWWGNG